MRPSNAIPYAHLQSLRSPLARTGWKTSANRLSPFLRSSLEAVATILGLIGFGCGWVAIASDTPAASNPTRASEPHWLAPTEPVFSIQDESRLSTAGYSGRGSGSCQSARSSTGECRNLADRRFQRLARGVLRESGADAMVDRSTS